METIRNVPFLPGSCVGYCQQQRDWGNLECTYYNEWENRECPARERVSGRIGPNGITTTGVSQDID